MAISQRTRDLIDKAFVLQRPTEAQIPVLDGIRAKAKEYAEYLAEACGEDSAELTLALRSLHLASQQAVTAVLFNDGR